MAATTSQYLFIFGAIVVAIVIFAGIGYITGFFDFTAAKRVVTLDTMQLLFESMDTYPGTYISGVVTPAEPVTVKDRTISIEGDSSASRYLLLAKNAQMHMDAIDGPTRIEATVSGDAVSYDAYPQAKCENVEAMKLEDVSDVDALRKESLSSPKSIVVLAASLSDYCSVAGLSKEYDMVQVYITPQVSRFTDKGVLVVAI